MTNSVDRGLRHSNGPAHCHTPLVLCSPTINGHLPSAIPTSSFSCHNLYITISLSIHRESQNHHITPIPPPLTRSEQERRRSSTSSRLDKHSPARPSHNGKPSGRDEEKIQ